MSGNQGQQDDLDAWPLERIGHRYLLHEAWRFRHNVSAYDTLYLALASLHDAAVLTADGPLARAPVRGVAIHSLRM